MPRSRAIPALLAMLLALGACGRPAPTATPGPSVAQPAGPAPSASAGAAVPERRPIVIDTDLAADDVLAMLALVRDDALAVRGVTIAGTGEVHCEPGVRNARRLLAALGAEDLPVACGREDPGSNGRSFPSEWRSGADALYGARLPALDGETARDESAAEVLVRLARREPGLLTVVALGPWTNLADAAALDPSFAGNLAAVHAMAGAVDVPGNVEVGATTGADGVEWNVGADPDAFAAFLAEHVPVTLVPLDATDDVPVPPDLAQQLEADHAAAGADIAYEMYARNPSLTGGSSFWDSLAAILLDHPAIAGWDDVAVRVEPTGNGAGHLSRDPSGRAVHAAMSADRDAFMAALFAALRTGAPRPQPFTSAGTLDIAWDGERCRIEGPAPSTAGLVRVELTNASPAEAAIAIGWARPPKTWSDVLDFVGSADLSDPGFAIPDWIVQLPGNLAAPARGTGSAIVDLPPGELGVLCVAGTFPAVQFVDGGTFRVGG